MIKHNVNTKDGIVEKELTPLRSIRLKCGECSNWQHSEIRDCHMTDCPLWVYRMGTDPSRKAPVLSDEQKMELRERLEKARQ